MPSRVWTGARLALALACAPALCGCETLGSATLTTQRTPLNEAIAHTAQQQTLMNIVRVYRNEAPVILEVIESDDTTQIAAGAMGGLGGIGARPGLMGGTLAGQVGSANGTVGFQESLVNRLAPLQGQALISQVSSPITIQTITSLYDSDWPIQSILAFTTDRLTPSNRTYFRAADLMTEIDSEGALAIAATKTDFGAEQERKASLGRNVTLSLQPPPTEVNSLNLYIGDKSAGARPFGEKRLEGELGGEWRELVGLYSRTQPTPDGKAALGDSVVPRRIELRTVPRPDKGLTSAQLQTENIIPLLKTRSALGVLKQAVTQPYIAFISPDEYAFVMGLPWNDNRILRHCESASSYALDPASEVAQQAHDPAVSSDHDYSENAPKRSRERDARVRSALVDAGRRRECLLAMPHATSGPNLIDDEVRLATVRRFILVVRSREEIAGCSTEWSSEGENFCIKKEDAVSQRNLMLISQILTIQATTTPSPALTTVSVGGH